MIKAVLFDLDGVIVSTDEYHYQAWKMIADKCGIYFDRQINNRLRGVSRMASLDIVLEKSDRSYSEEEKVQLATEKNDRYRELLNSLTPEHKEEGFDELLTYIKEKGIRTAVASSSKNTRTILEKIGLINSFDEIVDGNMISRSKPDPEVFLKAADLLGEDPRNCLVVEDAIAGVQAGKAAGMITVGIKDAAASEYSDHPVTSLTEIIQVIETLNRERNQNE